MKGFVLFFVSVKHNFAAYQASCPFSFTRFFTLSIPF